MNSLIKKIGFKIGLILAFLQMLITLHIYYNGSFIDSKFGVIIILLNIIFGIISAIVTKYRLQKVSLREVFSGYMISIIVSIFFSSIFNYLFFKTIATKERINKITSEITDFNIKNLKLNNFSDADILKFTETTKDFIPFSGSDVLQSAGKFFILYAVVGIIVAFVIKNKSSFQEIK